MLLTSSPRDVKRLNTERIDFMPQIRHLEAMQTPRTAPQNPVILIPARMASTRLPNKPLADIHGRPMIVHVVRRATESGLAPVIVACDSAAVAEAVQKEGGTAILTNPDLPSGSDRVWEALQKLPDGARYDAIINVQGDEPTLDPSFIRTAYALLQNPAVDIGTVASVITDAAKKTAPQVAKAVFDVEEGSSQGRALYFTRNPAPWGEGAQYHHAGLYAYRREALARFVATPPSPLEKREKLEQLRALSLGLRIDVAIVPTAPLGVDTPEDLEAARGKLVRQA